MAIDIHNRQHQSLPAAVCDACGYTVRLFAEFRSTDGMRMMQVCGQCLLAAWEGCQASEGPGPVRSAPTIGEPTP